MRRLAGGIAVFSIAAAALIHCAASLTPDERTKIDDLETRVATLESNRDHGAVASVDAAVADLVPRGPAVEASRANVRGAWSPDNPGVMDLRDAIDSGTFASLGSAGLPIPDFPRQTVAACLKQADDSTWSKDATAAAQADLAFISSHHMTSAFQVTLLSCRTSCCVFSLHWDHPTDAGGKIFEHVTNCMPRARIIQKNGDEELVTDCAGARQIGAVVKPALVDRGKGQNGGVWTYTPWDGSDGGIFPFRSP